MPEEVEPKQATMHVQVEVECTKCHEKQEVNVPVICEVKQNKDKQTMYCDIVGDLAQYLPKCKCGGELEALSEGEMVELEDPEEPEDKRAYN